MGARSLLSARWWGGGWQRRPPYTYARGEDLVYTRIDGWGSMFLDSDGLFWRMYRDDLRRISLSSVVTNIKV